MNHRQTRIRNRHIVEAGLIEVPEAVPVNGASANIAQAELMLKSLLDQVEVDELNRQLEGTSITGRRTILLHWYDMTEAREVLLEKDREVREAYANCELLDWALWWRGKARAYAKSLGLAIISEPISLNVVEVRIV